MSDVQTQIAAQLLVPASDWHDERAKRAALMKVGSELANMAVAHRERVDVENATVAPYGLKATVTRTKIDDGEPVAFVGYDLSDLEHADLVMIVVSAVVVTT